MNQHANESASAPTLCRHLAEYVASLQFESIPAAVISKAKALLLHDLAVAFGGIGTEQADRALAFIESREGVATVIGQPFKASPLDAALVNSVMCRALRMEDSIIPSFIHPGASLVPAALATAERYSSSGPEVLTALIAAYDVLGRIAGSLWTWEHGNRAPHHVFAGLGVAALTARLMRLDVEQTTGALAYAANLGAHITYGFQDFQYGLITRNGMLAAQLGKCRAPFPADALEGPYGFYASQLRGARPTDEEVVGATVPRHAIMSAVLKPHPCSAINLVPIELVRRQMREQRLRASEIRRITVRRARNSDRVPNIHSFGPFEGYLGGTYVATSSLPFALAVLLVDGEIAPARFSKPGDPVLAEMMKRVTIELREDFSVVQHEIDIETLSGEHVIARGDTEILPIPDAGELLRTYAVPVVGESKARELQQSIASLEQIGDMRAITGCLA